MKNEVHKRLYEMEISPPKQVWEFLSYELDEINKDLLISGKFQETAIPPPHSLWENIKDSLETEEDTIYRKKGLVINWKRLAVAAIFIGIIISAWLIFFIPQQGNKEIVTANTSSPAIQDDKILPENKEKNLSANQAENSSKTDPVLIAVHNKVSPNKKNIEPNKQAVFSALETELSPVSIKNDKPGDKVFNQPIDDLSMISPSDEYMTMVTTNGRIVKIPTHLAHLVPHLQDKPITEDYYELMFGEGAFWKEKMSEWRQMLATAPVTTGDMFSNMLELMKTVDDRTSKGK